MLTAGDREKVRSLIEPIGAAVFIMDVLPDGGFQGFTLNARAEEITGFVEAEDTHGLVEDFAPPELAARANARMQECVDQCTQLEFEEWIEGPLGRVCLRVILTPILDENERVVRILGTWINITEKQAAAERIEQAREYFQSLVEHGPDLVTVLDEDGVIQYQSPSLQRILGYTAEEAVGAEACSLVAPEDQDRIVESLQQSLSGSGAGEPTSVRFRHKDGRWRVLEAISSPFLAEEGGRFVVVNLRDVTGRLDAEQTLQESEERFRIVFEKGPIGMSVLGLDFRYLALNPRYCEILGYEEEELIGRSVMDITHPGDKEKDAMLGEQLFCGRIPFYVTEKRLLHGDGEYRWIRATASMVHDEAGHPRYGLGMIEDVTEVKVVREREARIQKELRETLTRALSGYAVICSSCQLMRSTDGVWVSLEEYVRDTPETRFNHELCPSCEKTHHPHLDREGSLDPES